MFPVIRRLVIFFLGLVAVLPVMAAEGRIPIFAPTIITSPGKYVVTQNIPPSAAGPATITVQSQDVDIDLNGFTVRGMMGFSAILVTGPSSNVAIRNGTIRDGDFGIQVLGLPPPATHKIAVEDVQILFPILSGILIQTATDFALRRNNIYGAGREGIFIDGAPGKTQGTIEHNRIEACGGGIWVRSGSSVGILNNRVKEILISGSPFPPASGAIVYDYSDDGLIAQNTVEDVRGTGALTDGNGIYLGDASGTKIHNNVVRAVSNDGIAIAGVSDDNLVLENVVTQSRRDGLRVEGSRNHIERNVLNRNCAGAGIGNCWGLHFVMGWGGADNTYGRNTARGNGGFAQMCPWPGVPPPPTSDFCNEQLPGPSGGNASFGDNYMPNLF